MAFIFDGFWPRLKRFFIRLSIYQIIFLWTLVKFNNVEKHAGEFKDKMMRNLGYFNLQSKELAEIFQDPMILFVICVLEFIFGIFGIFGSFYGNLISAILFLISSTVYF